MSSVKDVVQCSSKKFTTFKNRFYFDFSADWWRAKEGGNGEAKMWSSAYWWRRLKVVLWRILFWRACRGAHSEVGSEKLGHCIATRTTTSSHANTSGASHMLWARLYSYPSTPMPLFYGTHLLSLPMLPLPQYMKKKLLTFHFIDSFFSSSTFPHPSRSVEHKSSVWNPSFQRARRHLTDHTYSNSFSSLPHSRSVASRSLRCFERWARISSLSFLSSPFTFFAIVASLVDFLIFSSQKMLDRSRRMACTILRDTNWLSMFSS